MEYKLPQTCIDRLIELFGAEYWASCGDPNGTWEDCERYVDEQMKQFEEDLWEPLRKNLN